MDNDLLTPRSKQLKQDIDVIAGQIREKRNEIAEARSKLITLEEVVAMQHGVAKAFDWKTTEEQYWEDAAAEQAFEIQAENAWLVAAENNEEQRWETEQEALMVGWTGGYC